MNLSYVSQDNILLDYSIIENITYEKDYKKLMKKISESYLRPRLENLLGF